MRFNLTINGISPTREDHLKGVLISMLDVVDQILERRRKTSFLLHFLEERLTKGELKELSAFLKRLINELHRSEGSHNESQFLREAHEVERYLKRFKSFGDISEPATVPRQVPEAGTISPARKGKTLAREVLDISVEVKNNEA